MAYSLVCHYSTRGSVGEQCKHFLLHTGQQATVAIVVNALFMYLLGEEDLFPGVINGAAATLSINLAHKCVCCVYPKKTHQGVWNDAVRLMLFAFVNYVVIPRSYHFFNYRPKMRPLLEQTAFSYMGILGMQHYLEKQAKRKA